MLLGRQPRVWSGSSSGYQSSISALWIGDCLGYTTGSGKHLTTAWDPQILPWPVPLPWPDMQSPPDGFACVPFHSTRLFIGSRKEQPQIKRLLATWGLRGSGGGCKKCQCPFISPDQRGQISEWRRHYLVFNARYCRLPESWDDIDYWTVSTLQLWLCWGACLSRSG